MIFVKLLKSWSTLPKVIKKWKNNEKLLKG
jgi:hypothetical protein